MSSTVDSLALIPYDPNKHLKLQISDETAEKYRPAIMHAFLDIFLIMRQGGLRPIQVKPGEFRSEYAKRVMHLYQMTSKYTPAVIYRLFEIGSPNGDKYSPNTVLPLALIAKAIVNGEYTDKEQEFLNSIFRACFGLLPKGAIRANLLASTKWPQSYAPGEVWEYGVGRIA